MAESHTVEKVSRPRHYTPIEREIFLDLLTKYKDIIECKKSDNVSLKKKEDAWKAVEAAYNASHLISQQRSVAQLRKWWSNLKSQQREAKTKEMQGRLKTGGGPQEAVADIDPHIEVIAPHLMVTAPTLYSSNTIQSENGNTADVLGSETIDLVYMEQCDDMGNSSPISESPPQSTSSTTVSSAKTTCNKVPGSLSTRKRNSSALSNSSSNSGDESSARSERIRRITEREEEVHQAKFAIELQILQDQRHHLQKMQEIAEREACAKADEAAEKVREAKAKADEAAEKAREAKAKADMAELQLKRAKEEDEMY